MAHVALPAILQRTGVFLPSLVTPSGRATLAEIGAARYVAECASGNAHLAAATGELYAGVAVRVALDIDPGADPEFCSEVGTLPVAPRPLPMWVGAFPAQRLPNPI